MILGSPLTPIEHALRSVLDWLHVSLGIPWAWAVVVLTLLVRMILVPLTVRQIHSMQRMQAHMPQMKEIQKKYKGDRQKMNEELMRFYKENQINPAASCLPMVAQIPVFFALYFVLKNFSRHPPQGSLSWLHIVPSIADQATTHWSGYLLLAVYAGSQVSSTLLMATTMDRSQRMILLFLPIVFIFVVARFPVGLILYWATTNLWTVGQGVITRRLVPKTAAAQLLPKRSSRARPPDDGKQRAAEAEQAPAQAVAPKPPAARPARRVKRRKKRTRR